MNPSPDEEDRARVEAAQWFARAHGPEADEIAPALAAWRAEQPANDAAYARLLQRWDQSAFLANTRTARARDLRRVAAWPRRRAVRGFAVAAALVLAIGITVIGSRSAGLFRPAETPSAYSNPDRKVREILLADGSRATLDVGSAITVLFEKRQRRVRVDRGRVRFEVGKDQKAPFLVDARGGSIVAASGLFDVSLDHGIVRVVSWRGGLDVNATANRASTRDATVRLSPGEQIVFVASRPIPSVTRVDQSELGWTQGMLSFRRARLGDAVAAINRYNGNPIILDPPQIGMVRLTGAFRVSDPEGFARAAGAMFGLSVRHAPDGTIVMTPQTKA